MAVDLRVHRPPVKVQEVSIIPASRDSRPIVALVTHVIQRTEVVVAKTRSREIYGSVGIGNFIVEVIPVVPCAATIRASGLAIGSETRESVGSGHLEACGTRVVDGLDNGVG